MKSSYIYRILLVSAVILLTLSGCTTYKPAMLKTNNSPIAQQLPKMKVDFSVSPNINKNLQSFVNTYIKPVVMDEVNENIIDKDNSAYYGRMEIICENYTQKGDLLYIFGSALTLFTVNVLGCPTNKFSCNVGLRVNIYDNNNIIKTYSYDVSDKSYCGFYYGRIDMVVLVDATKKAMMEFRKDIERDAESITEQLYLTTPPYKPADLHPVEQAVIAQQQVQYYQQPVQQPVSQQMAYTQPTMPNAIKSDVDVNIPVTDRKSDDTFVLIIANENYKYVDKVDFAIHDGEVFKEYCVKTLGVPERQVWFCKDATVGDMLNGIDKMVRAMNKFENSKAIVYYCGHGIPDEHTGDAYIIPTDGDGKKMVTCYSLNKLYTTLAESNATSVTYFMDACFSGANKEGSMLVAARGVAREPKKEMLKGNTVVFSAASGDETAMTYKEKGHGLFTYFLLKKLQETNGDVSYGELDKYIKVNVEKQSFLINDKDQTPTTNVSENATETWKQMKLK